LSQPNEDFINNKVYRIAYRPKRNPAYSQVLDVELACPKCGCTHWIYHNRTGTGKLPKDQMKWKCKECGQWFICNQAEVVKILGL
jgi:transposase-like protein